MTPITNGAAGLIAAIAKPTENWSAKSAARQETLQLQGILTQQKEQEVLQEQQAQAQLEAQLQAARALPLMGRDQQKLRLHLDAEEKQVFGRLRDNYGGDARKFFAAEGQSWMAGANARLLKADWYQTATQNRQNILSAQEAIKKGERVVGTGGEGGYRTGEQQLQDFLSGKTDSFKYNGSYKPEDDLKMFRDQYAPGKMPWERVAVSEEEKLNHLIGQYGAEMGQDKYLRQHRGTTTFYKTAPLTDAVKFGQDNVRFGMEQGRYGMEKGRYAMAQQDQAMQRQLFGLQKEGLQLSNAKKKQELAGGGDGMGGTSYDHYLLSSPSEIVPLRHNPANPKQLSNGVDLGKVNRLAGVTLYGQGDDILARHLGLQRTRDGYRGQFDSAFTTENGVNAINLKGVKYDILGIDSKAFYDPSNLSPNASRQTPLQGYARVTLKFSPYDAEKAGLYDPNRLPFVDKQKPTSLFDSETKMGAGVYDPLTQTATLYVPAGDLRNANFLKAMQRSEKGTRSANEDFNAPFIPRPAW